MGPGPWRLLDQQAPCRLSSSGLRSRAVINPGRVNRPTRRRRAGGCVRGGAARGGSVEYEAFGAAGHHGDAVGALYVRGAGGVEWVGGCTCGRHLAAPCFIEEPAANRRWHCCTAAVNGEGRWQQQADQQNTGGRHGCFKDPLSASLGCHQNFRSAADGRHGDCSDGLPLWLVATVRLRLSAQ